jgi:dTDP-4-amino-4,6-dideoxygalactose transaminase
MNDKFNHISTFSYFLDLNVRNTDLSAFLGRGQLKKIDSFVQSRNREL